jgi:carbamate kinase
VEAVVDKDLASALLAQRLGVDVFIVATDVDRVYLDYGLPHARGIDAIDAVALRRLAEDGCFPPGTMGPKVEALLRFVERGGRAPSSRRTSLVAALHGPCRHAGGARRAEAGEPPSRPSGCESA